MSHYRAASITPVQTSTTDLYTYLFSGSLSFNSAYTGFPSTTAVGSVVNPGITYYFGDGSSVALYVKVTSIDTINHVLIGTPVLSTGAAITHTYASSAGVKNYTAYYETSARFATNDSFGNGNFRSQVTVNAGTTNHVPIAAAPAVVQVADNTVFTYQLAASDQDGDALTYAIGTANQFISASSSAANKVAPAGVTLSSTGLITWDVRNTGGAAVTPGQYYTMTLMVSDGKASTPVDFVFQIVDTSTNQAPVFSYVAPAQYFQAGDVNTAEVRATDANGNLSSITVLNAPAGLTTVYHASEGELHLNFAAATAGVYVVNVQAEDTAGLTTQTSVVYTVTAPPIADINGAAAGTIVTFAAADGAAAAVLLPAIVVNDSAANLNGAVFAVVGTLAEDRIAIQASGSVTAAGGVVSYGGTAIGTYTGGNGADFAITFNATATQAKVQDVLRHITYGDVAVPTTSHNLTATFTDAAGASIGTPASFTAGTAVPLAGATSSSPVLLDVNGDGRLDIVVGSADGTIRTLLANADGSYTQASGAQDPFAAIAGLTHASLNRYDYNGDGKVDIVAGLADGSIQVLQNNGAGNAFTQVAAASNPFAGIAAGADASVGFVDFDGDGKIDAVVGSAASHTLRAFHNTGTAFAEVTGSANPFNGIDPGTEAQPRFVDINRDGLRDLVVGNGAGGFTAYRNNGTGAAFTALPAAGNPLADITQASGNATLAFGDVNGDGNLDVVLGQQDGTLQRYVNQSVTGETIAVTHVNNAPVAAIADPGAATEQVALDLKGYLSLGDNDAGSGSLTATVSASYGVLHLDSGTSGATVASGNDTGTVVVTGTPAQINALFASDATSAIAYTANTDTPPAQTTLTLLVNDNGNTGSGGALTATATRTIALNAVNDAPVATITGLGTVIEQAAYDLRGHLSVSDVDAGMGTVTATVSADSGVITATAGNSGVQSIAGSGTGSVTVTGTLAQVNALFATAGTGTVSYTNTSDTPPAGAQVTLAINDGGNTGSGGALSATTSATLAIQAVNDAPTASITGLGTPIEQVPYDLKGHLSVADVDAGTGTVTATVGATYGVVTATAGDSGATVSGSGTPSLTVTGTLAQVNALFATGGTGTIAYTADTDTPPASATVTLNVNDGGNTGSGGALTGSASQTIAITAVNDAPVFTATGANGSYVENAAFVRVAPSVSLTDDNSSFSGGTLSVALTSGAAGGDAIGVLSSATAGQGIELSGTSVRYNGTAIGTVTANTATSSTVTFNAAATTAAIQALAQAVAYTNTGDNPGAADRVFQFTLVDGGGTANGGADTASFTRTVNVTPVNDAPTATIAAGTGPIVKAGGEILVSDNNTTYQVNPVAAQLAGGGFVVAWEDLSGANGGSSSDIRAQVYTAAGARVGGEILVNTIVASGQSVPAITALANGGFAVSWADFSGASGDNGNGDMRAQAFSATGAKVGGEVLVNTVVAGQQYNNQMVALSGGGYAVTWTDTTGSLGGVSYDVHAQVIDATGAKVGAELLVNTVTASYQYAQSTTALANGGFAVSWTDFSGASGDGGRGDIRAQIVSASGAKVGGELLVNATVTGNQNQTKIVGLANGGFAVTWIDASGASGDGGNGDIRAQVFTATGAKNGEELLVNTTVTGSQGSQQVAALSNGNFVVTWSDPSGTNGGSGYDVRAQVVTATGAKVGGEVLVNTTVTGNQYSEQVTALANGGFAIQWFDTSTDSNGNVRSQQFAADGSKVGVEQLLNTTTAGQQSPGAIVGAGAGYVGVFADGSVSNTQAIRAQVFQPQGYQATEQVALDFKGKLSVADVDANGGVLTATVSASYGIVHLATGTSGATIVSGNDTGSVVVSGTLAQLNALLSSDGTSAVTYTANTDTPPANATLTLAVNDNGNTGTGGALGASTSTTVAITAVNDAPTAAFANPGTATEQVALNLKGSMSVADADAGTGVLTATVTADYGIVTATAGDSGASVSGSGGSTVIVRGTIAQINALLGSGGTGTIAYTASTDAPPSSATLTLGVNDGGNTGTGGALSGSAQQVVTIAAVNDAPTATLSGLGTATEQVGYDLKGHVAVGDVDAGTGIVSATLSAGYGVIHLEAGSSGATIAGGNDTGAVSVTGTVAQINALFGGNATSVAVYTAATDAPPASTTLTLVVNDGGNTGSGGALSATATGTLALAAVNDAPIVGAPSAAAVTYTEDAAPVALFGGVTVSDPDQPASFTGGGFTIGTTGDGGINLATDGRYVVVTGPKGDVTLRTADGTVVGDISGVGTVNVAVSNLTSAATPALVSDLVQHFTYATPNQAPSADDRTLTLTFNDGGNTGSGGALSATRTQVLHTVPVDDAPVAHADAFATFENAVSTGNLFADNGSGADSDVDGPALSIASARAGTTQLVIGQATTLASGAVLTVNADGSYSFDPHHAYDRLAAASSGATADNTTASESFTYTLAGPAASPETKTATVSVTINGVDSDDTVTLTGAQDQNINPGGGNDTVNGQSGTGNYTVHGGSGDDVIFTGFGADHVYGDAGNDTIETGAGNDYVDAGDGDDLVIGGAGEGDDYYEGGAGEDRIAYPSQTGGLVIDLREARRDTDTTLPSDVHDRIQAVLAANGQPASATVGYAYGGAIGVDVLHGFEDATGGAGDDVIFGNDLANKINGGAGNDTISGGGGNDTLDGGAGVNTLYYGDLTNAVQVNLVEGTVNAGRQGGFDTIANFQNVVLGAGNDQFIGDAGDNRIEGGAGNDTIDGGDGIDTAVYRGVLPADGIAIHSVDELIVTPGGGLGTDRLTNVEQLEFINGTDVVDIQIVGGNAVVFSRADTGAVAEQSTLSVSAAAGVLANDVNIDQRVGDQKVVAAVAHGSAAGTVGAALVGDYGSLTLNADGSYTYVADDRTDPLPAGTKVTDVFTYTADDGQAGDSTPTTLTITITGTNDVPVLGGRTTGAVSEDFGAHPQAGTAASANLTDSGQLTIADPDTGESSFQAGTFAGQYGTFTLTAGGVWSYAAANDQPAIQQLGEGRTLADSFTAVSRDGTASEAVVVTITGTNDQPVLTGGSIGSYTDTAAADTFAPISGTIGQSVGTLADADVGDRYSYALTGTPDTTYGTLAVNTDGSYVFTPNGAAINALHAGPVTVNYAVQVNDGSGATNATSSATFSLTLNGANDIAVVGGVTTGEVREDNGAHDPASVAPSGRIATSGLLTVADRDSGESSFQTATTQGSYGTFTLGADGAWSYSADDTQAAIQRLGEGETLTERFTATSQDGSASEAVTVTIRGTNDQPVLTGGSLGTIDDTSATDRFAALTGQIDHDTAANAAGIVGNLADADASGTYSFTLLGTPDTTYGTLSVNADGSYSFQPNDAAINGLTGPVTLTYQVQVDDGSGAANAKGVAAFTIQLNGTQDMAVIGGTTAVGVTEDQGVTTDANGAHVLTATGALTISDADAASDPQEATFAPDTQQGQYGTFTIGADGKYSYVADNDQVAIQRLGQGATLTETFYAVSHDGNSEQQITVTVTGTNDAPVVTSRLLDTTAANASLATATNIDGAFTLLPNRDTINATTVPHASIQGTTSAGAIDYYSFTVAKDGSVVTLDVDNVNQDTTLALYDANGRVVARNDDDGSDPGETNSVASFIRVTLAAGTYTVALDHYPGLGNGQAANPLPAGTTYDLQVSVENHAVTNPYLHALTESDAPLAVNGRVFAIDDVGDTDTFSHTSGNSQITSTGFTLTQAQTQAIEAGFTVDANGAYHFALASPDYLDAGQRITAVFNVDVTDQLGAHTTQGVTVTIDGTLETGPAGTTGDDTLTGGNYGDLINGGDGDDIIRGLGGNDHLIGGLGDDNIDGGSGDDLIEGNDGDDRLSGGSGNDTILGGVGNDIILGGSGNDVMTGGPGDDQIDGGDGFDTAVFSGRYADYTITQTGTNSYRLVHQVAGGLETDTVTNTEAFRFDDFTWLPGSAGADTIDLSTTTGPHLVQAGAGNDVIYAGAGFTAADRIDGGTGNDQLGLQGNYTGGNALVLGPTTITNVETLALLPHAAGQPLAGYAITANDAMVAAGQQMSIYGSNLGAGENLTFDGSAETDGSFRVFGGAGTDILTGSANNDAFYFGPGKYGPSDVVHGGGGSNDQIGLDGNYTVTLDSRADVETVALLPGPSDDLNHFNVTVADSFVAAGQTKTIYAVATLTSLVIDGSGELDGNLTIYGGHAADTIHGGAGNDFIFGGEGGDTLFGGAGADTFSYYDAAQSSSTGFDTLADFDPTQDVISIEGHVKGAYSSVAGGGLSTATFDADLQAAVGSRLHGGDAVFYTPDSGDYAGQTFLIVNSDGTDGYQAGHDYVFHLPTGFATTGLGDFIVG